MAKSSVGELNVLLSLNSTKFTKGIKKATANLSKFGKTVSAFGVGAAAAAAGGLLVMARSSLKTMDAAAKLADRLGTTTEAISSLRFAAEQGGASAEVMDVALRQLSVRIGEATQGTGEAVAIFERMGLTANELAQMPLDQALGVIADEMNMLASASDRAMVAQRLFGRSGTELINTLAGGSVGLMQMRAEAEALGLTFDRSAAAKAEMANDAINRMRHSIVGLANSLATEMAPMITVIADLMTDWASRTGDARNTIVDSFGDILKMVAHLSDFLQVIVGMLRIVQTIVLSIALVVTSVIGLVAVGLDMIVSKLTGDASNAAVQYAGIVQSLAKDVANAGKGVGEAFGKAANQTASKKIDELLNEIESKAASASKTMATSAARQMATIAPPFSVKVADPAEPDRTAPMLPAAPMFQAPEQSAASASFAQVNKAYMALGGPSRSSGTQRVEVGGATLSVLKSIDERLRGGVPSVAM